MSLTIAVAPNAFRGSMTAIQAAQAIASGLAASDLACDIQFMPLADGGDGTVAVWAQAVGAQKITVTVTGPRGRPVQATFGLKGQTALVGMAQASGIELLAPDERNPLLTTTYGTGEVIKAAIEHGATEVLLGIGGSATVDGGAGCLQALGARLLDAEGADIPHGGGHLDRLARIDAEPLRQLLDGVTIRVLCDVDNPLTGAQGAAPVFAPQKGADEQMVTQLARNLAHFAEILAADTGVDVAQLPRTGAAGGIGAGLHAVAGAALVSGVETLIRACGYDTRLAQGDIDLLITGEGQLDEQTASGKAPFGIAQIARQHGVPVIGLAGSVRATPQMVRSWGLVAAFSIVPGVFPLEEALTHGPQWLADTARRLGDVLALGGQFSTQD